MLTNGRGSNPEFKYIFQRTQNECVVHQNVKDILHMAKSTKLELKKRYQRIFDMVLAGYRQDQIFRFVTDKHSMNGKPWEISYRQFENYMRKVRDMFKEHAQFESIEELGKAKTRLMDLFARASSTKDKLAVAREMHDILGLRETRIKLETNPNVVKEITVNIIKPKSGNGKPENGEEENNGGGK